MHVTCKFWFMYCLISIFPIMQNMFLYKVVNVILKATNIILMCLQLYKQVFTVRDFTGYENGLAFLLTARFSRIAISNKLAKKELKKLQAKRA